MNKGAVLGLMVLGACTLFMGGAKAQQAGQAVVVYGNPSWGCAIVTSTGVAPAACVNNLSGTVTTTGTFQLVFPAVFSPNKRVGCTIQNNGTGNLDVFPGPVALATVAASVVVAPGGTFYCGGPGGSVLQDAISVTGTTGGVVYA